MDWGFKGRWPGCGGCGGCCGAPSWGGDDGFWGAGPSGYCGAVAGGRSESRGGHPYEGAGKSGGGCRDRDRDGGTGNPEKDDLIMRVKGIQKSSREGREHWEAYCDAARTGNRDPMKHTTESLRIYVRAYENGDSPERAAELLASSEDDYVIRLRGVPFQSDVLDIVSFLSEYHVDESDITMGKGADGRATGEAFVVMKSAEATASVMEQMQRKEIRGRYIEVFKSSMEEKAQNDKLHRPGNLSGNQEKDELATRIKVIQRSSREGRDQWERYCEQLKTGSHDPMRQPTQALRNFLEAYHKGQNPDVVPIAPSRAIRLRGVPFQSDIMDVVEFLADFRVEQTQVVLGKSPDGRPTGEAYAILRNADDAEIAMTTMQRKEIRGRYIEVFRSCEEEFESHKTPLATPSGGGGDSSWGDAAGDSSEAKEDAEKDILVQKVKAIQRGDAAGKQQWYDFCDALKAGNRDPSRHTKDSLGNFLYAYETGIPMEQAAEEGVGDGRYLRLRGVPFQCGRKEVAEFLREYGVEEVDITMGKGAGGKPSGEAFVIFSSREKADDALEKKQKQEIRGRYIELFRSSEEEAYVCANEDTTKGREAAGPPKRASIPPSASVLRLRGLPHGTKVSEIVDFLKDYDVDASQIALGFRDGKISGEAYIGFPSKSVAKDVLASKHMAHMGPRYIEIFNSSYDEMVEGTEGLGRDEGWRGGAGWEEGHGGGLGWGCGGCCDACGKGGFGKGEGYGAVGGYAKGGGRPHPYDMEIDRMGKGWDCGKGFGKGGFGMDGMGCMGPMGCMGCMHPMACMAAMAQMAARMGCMGGKGWADGCGGDPYDFGSWGGFVGGSKGEGCGGPPSGPRGRGGYGGSGGRSYDDDRGCGGGASGRRR